ncbi:DUF4124 domain-containing protein [Cupriavidus plantarum]|uniref:DUF4124 domain-containing protein n=2 Tax=Cupriavidus plantarum TaxID=942865 RepID=UPI000E38196D|nr:hypothetical protein C7418_1083 [Cupriavidus plantarum]
MNTNWDAAGDDIAQRRGAPRARAVTHQLRVAIPILGLALVAALTMWNSPAFAQSSDVYVCAGPNGVPEYRNGNAGKNCKKLTLPEVVTVPGGARPQSSRGTGTAASPTSFPRVDGALQKSRDGERRGVLEQELQSEEAKLAALRAEYNNGEPERQGNERNYQKYLDRTAALRDDIARSEANLASLRRELSNLKD